MSFKVYLSPPHLSDSVVSNLKEVIQSNWIAPVGPKLEEWEAAIAKQTGKYALLTTSGESALELALRLVGVTSGSQVVCATHTCNATVNAILHLGAEPIFIDSETESWNMSPEWLEQCLQKKTQDGTIGSVKAVVPVHIYGMPSKMKELSQIASKYSLPIVEDAAESLGSTYNGMLTGIIGDSGIWSFNGNKIITSGGGGAVVCNSPSERAQLLKWATQSKDDADWFQHSEIGHTFRMSNVLAAIGVSQWEVLSERVEAKQAIYQRYVLLFERLGISKLVRSQELNNAISNRWLSAFLFDERLGVSPTELLRFLKSKGIEGRHFWKPMHLQPVYTKYDYFGDGYSEFLFDHGVCLPSGTNYTSEQWELIEGSLIEFFQMQS